MHITIALDTDQLTDRDRRVLAALVSDDGAPLVLPRMDDTSHLNVPDDGRKVPTMPSPTPAPPPFMQRLGEAVGQFAGGQGAAHEARLPFAEQAGVRTRSTMPEDDAEPDAAPPGEPALHIVDEAVLHIDRPVSVVHVDSPPPVHADRDRDRVRAPIVGTVDAPVRHSTP